MKKKNLKSIWEVIKKTFGGFGEHKIMKLSASLAYTTIFSMAPLLVLILFFCGIVFGRDAVEGTIYEQIKGFVGAASAEQVQSMIRTSAKATSGTLAGIIGVIALIVAATSLFAEIQDSINTIWGVRPKKGSGIKGFLKTRLVSFGVIGSLGFLLLVTLGVSTVMDSLGERLIRRFSDSAVVGIYIFNFIITLGVVTVLFGVIFKVLPDADIKWKQVRTAAIVTAVLFIIGKFLISFYIAKSNVGSTFGAAGSLVVLLVWVYYSSVILYLGAEFAKQHAMAFGTPIKPSHFAETVQTVEVATGSNSLQHAEKKTAEVKDAKQIAEDVVKQAHADKEVIIADAKKTAAEQSDKTDAAA